MSLELPEAVTAYFEADNRHDPAAAKACFAEDAIVVDESRTRSGLAAIEQWISETAEKYQHTIEPLKSEQHDNKLVVTSRLTGTFPGSPIEVNFSFELLDGRIVKLEIG